MTLSAMEAIKQRRTVRRYRPDPVPSELLARAGEAATRAPTSANIQPWEFIRVVTPEVKEQLVASTYGGYSQTVSSQAWLLDAPELLAACSNAVRTVARYGEDGRRYARRDVAAAIQNMLIAATALGLGAAWIGGFRELEARYALNFDRELELIGLIALGYSAEEPAKPYRMPISYIFTEV